MQLLILLLLGLIIYATPVYAKTWAAQFSYGAGELSPVFHANRREKVLAQAHAFCQQTELCRSRYQINDLAVGVVATNNLFVTIVCRQMSSDDIYVTVPTPYDEDKGRKDGKQKGLEKLKAAGLSTDDCAIHAVYGVKSKKQLWTGETAHQAEVVPAKAGGKIRLWKLQRRNATRTTREVLISP